LKSEKEVAAVAARKDSKIAGRDVAKNKYSKMVKRWRIKVCDGDTEESESDDSENSHESTENDDSDEEEEIADPVDLSQRTRGVIGARTKITRGDAGSALKFIGLDPGVCNIVVTDNGTVLSRSEWREVCGYVARAHHNAKRDYFSSDVMKQA
jgi:hypothetical protein